MIPEGWSIEPIGEHVGVQGGYAFKSALFGSEGVPVVRISSIQDGGVQLTDAPLHPHDESLQRFELNDGDVLIAMSGATTGKLGRYVPVDPSKKAYLNQRVGRLIPKNGDRRDLDFFWYVFHTDHVQNAIVDDSIGGAQPNVSGSDIERVLVRTPPAIERREIAEMLKTWDRAIETVAALIVNARSQKHALLQQLLPQGTALPKKRIPGFSGEWCDAKLGLLADISKGQQKGRASLSDDGPVPVINGGVTPSGYTNHPNTAAGTITISEGGNSCGYVDLITRPFWCGGHCYALENLNVDRDYLYAVLKHREAQIMSLRVGSGLPNIQKKALSQFEIPTPSKPEQVKIGELAALADHEIAAHETQLSALRQEKAALMQQLLAGKRRVKVDRRAAA